MSSAGQPERPAALRADDLGQRDVVADFDRVAAVGANDVQRPQRKMAIAHASARPKAACRRLPRRFPPHTAETAGRNRPPPAARPRRSDTPVRPPGALETGSFGWVRRRRPDSLPSAAAGRISRSPRTGRRIWSIWSIDDSVRRRLMGRKFHADRSGAVSHHPSIVSRFRVQHKLLRRRVTIS